MQAPTYIERSQALLLMREQEQMMHAAKMGKIAGVSDAVTQAKGVTRMMQKNRQDRKKTKDFLTNEKNITINKDNQILLNKLVEISSGKWSSVAPVPKKAGPVRGKSVRVNGPTSLNMGVRKRETERIERENHAFAKRLFDKQAVLQKKNLDTDWVSHQKYKKQITKMPKGWKQGDQQFNSQQFKGGYSASNMRSDPNLQYGEEGAEGMQQDEGDDGQEQMEMEQDQIEQEEAQQQQEEGEEPEDVPQQQEETEGEVEVQQEEKADEAPATEDAPAESKAEDDAPAVEEQKDGE